MTFVILMPRRRYGHLCKSFIVIDITCHARGTDCRSSSADNGPHGGRLQLTCGFKRAIESLVGLSLPQSTVVDCKFIFVFFLKMSSEEVEPKTANASADGTDIHDPEKLAAVAENADALRLLAL